MSRTVYLRWVTGQTIYAKPSPVSSDPSWDDDAIVFTEIDTTGQYTGVIEDSHHAVYLQGNANPETTDKAIGEFTEECVSGSTEQPEGSIPYPITVQDNELDLIPNAVVTVTPGGITGRTNGEGTVTMHLLPGEKSFVIESLKGYDPHTPVTDTITNDSIGIVLSLTLATDEEEGLDLSGIKRVKTKHMEIEAHDPEVMQRVRDKENTPLPCFGDSHFCKATPKC